MSADRDAPSRSTFAVIFDLDSDSLKQTYGGADWEAAYGDIRGFLSHQGFTRRGGIYFGDETVNEVSCVLAIQELTDEFEWFAPSVRDIRMLRIESNNDLMPAVERAVRKKAG